MKNQCASTGKTYIKYGRKRKVHYETNIPYIIYNNRRVYFTDIMRLENPIKINTIICVNSHGTVTHGNVLTGYIYEGAWVQTYVEVVDFETVQLWKESEV